ncbi:Hypothetical protein LUCI_0443 [Lucifera butyrica]|uniref:Carbohydrate binding module family 25 domain-containing protein n=1 Tax=Lucifera butyrica TaxID=1351585 RepID=A0A498QYH4_9FIRM|nr:carbohydrate-binding protein [Lucifera butyrica]VBB05236.1 Hypothetical protein LUCI_0443 [Lucifera butyrica]
MLTKNTDKYQNHGVILHSGSNRVRVVYNGLLAQSGAEHIYAHTGFGNHWSETYDHQMLRTSQGFEADIPVNHSTTLNMAFKDCANNWDNNAGHNYSFEIYQ